MRQQRIRRSRPDIQEKRRIVRHHPFQLRRPLPAPSQKLLARCRVLEALVVDPEIVRRRSDHKVNRSGGQTGQDLKAIAMEKIHR